MPNKPTVSSASILSIKPYVGGKSKGLPGVKVVKLSSNETPLGPSPEAVKAVHTALQQLHRYPDGGAHDLRDAIADVHGLPVERIVCGCGSDELIGLLIHAYAGAGDEVVISQHGFLMYQIYAQSCGATPVFAAEKNLRTDVDAMLAAVTPRTKIVCVANPNNPTGSYISKSELKRLHDGLPSHVLLLVDGAYAEYVKLDDYSCGRELVESSENTVMLRTFSKIYGLSALRVGWAYAPESIIDILNRVRSPFNVSGLGIAAGAAAMRDVAFTETVRAFNQEQLEFLSAEISKLGFTVHPSVGNFILVDFTSAQRAVAASAHLTQRGLIVREVAAYGLDTCLRISIGLEEDNKAVVAALASFLR
ncbi:MAG: histidinol-phosphate transaminase [Rickettsiales bacterium]|nr:histidinol-phosphate transaminase [Rickettsiales bacterium]